MKVFMCQRQGGYSGGLAVVAANSKEEALPLAQVPRKEVSRKPLSEETANDLLDKLQAIELTLEELKNYKVR